MDADDPFPSPSQLTGSRNPAAERKFGVPSAKIYPLLNHLVLTPEGAGILLQVFHDRVQVHFKGEHQTRKFRPGEIVIPAEQGVGGISSEQTL